MTEQSLKGAEFQVLTADGKYVDDMGGALSSNGIYTTDERGQVLISGLNPGVLVVKETKAPDGYMLDDKPQTVEMKASETQTLTFHDVPKQTVIVQKYVEGTTNPLPGVTFLITDDEDNRIRSVALDELVRKVAAWKPWASDMLKLRIMGFSDTDCAVMIAKRYRVTERNYRKRLDKFLESFKNNVT